MRTLYTILLLFTCLITKAQNFPYRYLAPITISPTEEINCMFFDKEGLMWVGSNAGVKSYDGYQVKTYKSSAFLPGILPNNTILSIDEDKNDNLWLGTRNGLVRMNKRTGEFKTFFLPDESQRVIYTLFTTKDGTLWIGTDGGLSYFNPNNESFYTYNHQNSWLIDETGHKARITNYSVKAIAEDKNGDLLIGTWAAGLLRFNRGGNVFMRYPKLNNTNSAYSLFFDKKNRLWIGTWGYGVIRMDNPSVVKNPKIYQYPYTTSHFDTYYKIVEDPVTQSLWACTREGVCFLNENDVNKPWQCYNQIGNNSLNFNNDIATDGAGNIWLCTQNFGIVQVNTATSPFKLWSLDTSKNHLIINYINSMMTTDGAWFWIGLNPYGLALYNRNTGATLYNREISGFSSIEPRIFTTSISSIVKRNNGEIWFANNNYGLIVKPKDRPALILNRSNTPYVKEDFVNTLFESRDKVLWIGHRSGLSIVYPNNKGTILTMKEGKNDFSNCDVRNIYQDQQGALWVATDNEGIIRITGSASRPHSFRYKQYNPENKNFAIDDATACLEDSHHRLWAISNSGGLFLYNKEKDRFEPKNRDYHLPGDRALAIQEDKFGNLWLTTDNALIHIVWQGNESQPKDITYFTKEDGLGDILFSANTTCSYGKELFFGSRTSFFSFIPTPNIGQGNQRKAKLLITDMIIDDVPFAQLDSTEESSISAEMPSYTHHINLPSHIKKLSVEFSLLTYGNANKNMYAYRLDGYDEDWQFCNGEVHRATFQNLASGTYQLHVKATDSYGHWQELPYSITIKVLPPWYASRVAYMVYILLFIGAVFGFARWYKEHLKTKNRLQMGVILTNITHELLTPLTVISATIYKLKSMAPQYSEDYLVMDSNINRTTRLLRQILEVRKSQAGQLKLLVSKGDLAAFVRNACESIRPMATHQQISLKLDIPESERIGWFDADKLDKILYNLLSNAIKYNKVEGTIAVSLTVNREQATITISDNGIGMSQEKLKHLYTRFFDGDYRKQNKPGTGIGLSLTHDLVKLHHGDIRCESTEGKGTAFTVSFPVKKAAYDAAEIDNSNISKRVDHLAIQQVMQDETNKKEEVNPHSVFIRKDMSKILVVEDNDELLALMLQMLSRNYHVLTAKNGKQAYNIIMKEQLDLVVSDVMMPIMDGIELTKLIKEDKRFWQLPIILLTAKSKEEDKTEGYATGADAYITKPFKFEELEVRIDTLITNHQKTKESFSQIGNGHESEKQEDAHKHFSDPNKVFIDKATKLVLEHLDDADYDRDTFANDMAMGASTLYNKIKATTGKTVVGFIMNIRLKEARRIMASNPDILISEVALRVGFNTPKYFSKCFKKEFGMFPREYAEELKKQS